jgi:hypothetical protein
VVESYGMSKLVHDYTFLECEWLMCRDSEMLM